MRQLHGSAFVQDFEPPDLFLVAAQYLLVNHIFSKSKIVNTSSSRSIFSSMACSPSCSDSRLSPAATAATGCQIKRRNRTARKSACRLSAPSKPTAKFGLSGFGSPKMLHSSARLHISSSKSSSESGSPTCLPISQNSCPKSSILPRS